LRRTGERAHLVLLYAWNPLLAIEVAGSGHGRYCWRSTAAGVCSCFNAALALDRAAALGLAIAVKLLPLVLLPLYWKRIRIHDGAIATLVVALLYVAFLNHGRIPIGSLGTYVQSFRFNDPIFATLERVAPPQVVAGVAVLVGLLTAIWMRRKMPTWPSEAFAWPMAASLFVRRPCIPGNLLWLLPFARSTSTLPLIIWTVSIIPAYCVWHLRVLGRPWLVPGGRCCWNNGAVATAGANYRVAQSYQASIS